MQAGIDGAAGYGVDELAVGCHHLQKGLHLGVHEAGSDQLKRGVDLAVKAGFAGGFVAYGAAYAGSRVEEDHGDGVAYGLELGEIFGFEDAGGVDETHYVGKELEGLAAIFRLLGSYGVFAHGNRGKALRKHIAALAQRLALGGHLKIHAAVGVEAVCLDEVDAALGHTDIFSRRLDVIVGK